MDFILKDMRRIFFSYLFKLKILFLILFCNYFSSSHSLSALISIPSLKINSKNLNKQHRVNKRFGQ